ncbi:MAG: hypothetical protein U9R74_12355 [Pseudomonadota bacterium]|nr:hypothetical protein [Pseudomonadota bacterium]
MAADAVLPAAHRQLSAPRRRATVIRIGAAHGSDWIVEDVLKAGESVISEGLQKIQKSGVAVKVVPAKGSTAKGSVATPSG